MSWLHHAAHITFATIAIVGLIVVVSWFIGGRTKHPTPEELFGCSFVEADKHGGECP